MKRMFYLGLCLWTVPICAQINFRTGSVNHTDGFRSGVAVMVTDANGDGRDDIIRMHNGDRVTVTLQGQEERLFTSFFYQLFGSEQWNISGGDLDNDGYLDIVTSGAYDRLKIFRSRPSGIDYDLEIINDQTFFAQASSIADIDNDGFLDVFICNDDQRSVIFMNDGTGHLVRNDTIIDFTTAIPSDNSGNYGSIWSDIDSDGDLDLYISKCRQGVVNPADPRRVNALYLNNGDNTFTESADSFNLAIGAQSWTADFGDIDNDGDFDVFITNHDSPGQLLENIDNAYFEDITDSSGILVTGVTMQATFRDFDNDGLLDLIVSGSMDYLYRNLGEKQFESVGGIFSDRRISSYAIGDLNSDGFLDVYATYNELFNEPHSIVSDTIWYNTGNANHFLTIHLAGTHCNASAVGARLFLYGPMGMQTREVRAGEGYGITNSLTQHFGLGQATSMDSLVVIWPCGTKEIFSELMVDAHYRLEEGSCITEILRLEAGPFTQCADESFSITAPQDFVSYLWNAGGTGSTDVTLTIDAPGVFHVSLTDDTGCKWVAGPVIMSPSEDVQPDNIEIDVDGQTLLCSGDEVRLSGPPAAISYLWNTGDTTMTINPHESGDYLVMAGFICGVLTSDPVSISFSDPNDLVLINDTIQGAGSGTLEALGDSIVWFSDPGGMEELGYGQFLITPPVDTTTTFYARQTTIIQGDQLTAGQKEHRGVTLYSSNQTNGAIRFDVFSRFRIDSVLVFTMFPGERTILIVDDIIEDTLYSQTFQIDSGSMYIPLNVWLDPGTDFLITTDVSKNQETFNFNSPRLVRSDRELLYPFTVPDVLSLTGTQNSQMFYYYFYDWHITRENRYCEGETQPVQVVVLDTSSAVYSPVIVKVECVPNPADQYVRIGDESFFSQAEDVFVCDTKGNAVSGYVVDKPGSKIEINKLPDGMYYVSIRRKDKVYVGRFVKMQH